MIRTGAEPKRFDSAPFYAEYAKSIFHFCLMVGIIQVTGLISTLEVNASSTPLRYAPPTLTNPTTIYVTNANRAAVLSADKDYIIIIAEKITASGGVRISCNGARNVVLIGGEIDIPWQGDYQPGSEFGHKRRGMYITDWKGVFHLEGLWMHGEDLGEGIDVATDYPNATFQVQNVRIDGVCGRQEQRDVNFSGVGHPDIIQNWAGPKYYYIVRLTGETDYQGFMLQPQQYGYATEEMIFSNVNIKKTFSAGYQFFRSSQGINNMTLDNVNYIKRDGSTYAAASFAYETWHTVKVVLNTNTDKCDIYFNDVKIINQYDSRTAVANVNKLTLITGYSNVGNSYFDNILTTVP